MKRAYVRRVRGIPVDDQRAALVADGVDQDVIYGGDNAIEAIASLRPDDQLCLGGSLRILADSREGIREAVNMAHARGCSIRDVTTDQSSGPGDGADMMATAIADIAQDKRRGLDPKAAARARWGEPKRMAVSEAHGHWFNRANRTANDALDHMTGWTRIAAYRQFGPRNFR